MTDTFDRTRRDFLTVATAGGAVLKSFPFAGHPALRKVLVAKQALNLLRLALSRRAV